MLQTFVLRVPEYETSDAEVTHSAQGLAYRLMQTEILNKREQVIFVPLSLILGSLQCRSV
jgi:hypothetical protein